MYKYDFVAFDFETANSYKDSACQIGITAVKNGKIEEVRSWLINTEDMYFSDFNISIHGITKEMVKDRPTFKELWPELSEYLTENILFAHNARFDIEVLYAMLDHYDIEIPIIRFGCSIALSRRTWFKEASYSLDALCSNYNIKKGNHDAGEDSRACAELVLLAMREHNYEFNNPPIKASEDFFEMENKLGIYFGMMDSEGYMSSICKPLSSFRGKIQKVIIGDVTKNNVDSPFYQKNVVFTGQLSSMTRAEAQQIVADIGGINQKGLTKDTNYLIVGQQDYRVVGDDGMSSKQKKAIDYIEKGLFIEIISEKEFWEMI